MAALEHERPQVAVIDSIQTLYSDALASAPGSVAQVRECAAQLTRFAKVRGHYHPAGRACDQGWCDSRPARAGAHRRCAVF